MLNRKNLKPAICGLVFAAGLGFGAVKANALEPQYRASSGYSATSETSAFNDSGYCHLKIPAVVNADPTAKTDEMIDFYGPCDQDQNSKDQVMTQQNQLSSEWETNYES